MLELKEMKEIGALGRVPWQVYLSDVLLLFPQQLLPFEKIDPVLWYTNVTQSAGFFVYGVIAQAILGLDWIELIIRGIVLGGIMAAFHRWYVRRASSFWVTLFYCWLMLWSYNAVRNTTFYLVVWIVYRFVPAVLLVGVSVTSRDCLLGREERGWSEVSSLRCVAVAEGISARTARQD